ncbi:uncharacterized protein PAC_06971 [Phialocephala subalpina]|uniref:Uncharacterized protein n=1 Tax=Phialocephala subalpina TaxID=576137 RepID=A0A1L7WWD0_9HELO|nr:uncharacterized protein PAC_06971 [Phialocephala subalpina]
MDFENHTPMADNSLDLELAKLKTTLKIEGFQHLARVITYQGFIQDIDALNGAINNMCKIAEYAWLKLVQQEHAKWDSKYMSEETKNVQLHRALDQGDKIEQFWADKELNEDGKSANVNLQQACGPADWFRSLNPDAPKPKAGSKAFKRARIKKVRQEKLLRKQIKNKKNRELKALESSMSKLQLPDQMS